MAHELKSPATLAVATKLGLDVRSRDLGWIETRTVVHDQNLERRRHFLRMGDHLDLDLTMSVLECVEAGLNNCELDFLQGIMGKVQPLPDVVDSPASQQLGIVNPRKDEADTPGLTHEGDPERTRLKAQQQAEEAPHNACALEKGLRTNSAATTQNASCGNRPGMQQGLQEPTGESCR